MLLSEMVRHIKQEKLLFSSGSYCEQNAVTDWVTKLSKTINLDAASLIHVQFSLFLYSSGSAAYVRGNGRVLIDGTPVLATGERSQAGGSAEYPISAFIYLSSGNHTFDFQIAVHRLDTDCYARLQNFYIRQLDFADLTTLSQDSGNVNVDNNATVTVLNVNITVPARRLSVGKVKNTPLRLVVYVKDGLRRYNVFKNLGESDTNDRLNWKLLVNDTQVSWTVNAGDIDSGDTTNFSYAIGGYGYYEAILTAGTQYNIKLNVTNTISTVRIVRAVMTIFACPWIIGANEYEPFELGFPQGSTLYLTLEPLSSDPTKTIKLGYVRAWDLGYNFYSSANGTGILNWSYTFESVEVGQVVLTVGGSGGCISMIGVDVR